MMQSPPEDRAESEKAPPADTAARWAAFSSSGGFPERVATWLSLVAERIPSARAGYVFRRSAEAQSVSLAGHWGAAVGEPAEVQISARQGFTRPIALVRSVGSRFHLITRPDHYPDWVIVFECDAVPAHALQEGLEELRWGAGWLVASIERAAGQETGVRSRRFAQVVPAIEACGQASDLPGAARSLADALASAFPALLVSVGVTRHGVLTLAARQGPEAGAGSEDDDLRREALVQVAIDRETVLLASVLPESIPESGPEVDPDLGPRVCALPLVGAGGCAGVLLCERPQGPAFEAEELVSLRQVAVLAAPLIELKPVSRSRQGGASRPGLGSLLGRSHGGWKVGLVGGLALVLLLLGATGEYQAPVSVVVEGGTPRKVTAPFEGKLAEVLVQPGDGVRRGQVLARFDEAEAQVERGRLGAERERLLQALKEAKQGEDQAAVETLGVRRRELETRVAALDERMSALQILSPVDGVVQAAPPRAGARGAVQAGQDLFAIVQPDSYRLLIEAADADRELLREGQRGEARLDGSSVPVPFAVTRVMEADPASGARRIEAQAPRLGSDAAPGAEGVGTIDLGTRKQVWIWWRRLQSRT